MNSKKYCRMRSTGGYEAWHIRDYILFEKNLEIGIEDWIVMGLVCFVNPVLVLVECL